MKKINKIKSSSVSDAPPRFKIEGNELVDVDGEHYPIENGVVEFSSYYGDNTSLADLPKGLTYQVCFFPGENIQINVCVIQFRPDLTNPDGSINVSVFSRIPFAHNTDILSLNTWVHILCLSIANDTESKIHAEFFRDSENGFALSVRITFPMTVHIFEDVEIIVEAKLKEWSDSIDTAHRRALTVIKSLENKLLVNENEKRLSSAVAKKHTGLAKQSD